MAVEETLHDKAVEAHINATGIQNGANGAHNTNGMNGHDHDEPKPIESTAAYKPYKQAYELSKLPFLYPRKLKVIIAGGGASAFSFAHEVQVGNLRNIDLQIFEKNAGIGGTWFENRYPGIACDVPAHAYLFTWAPNPSWSQYYASGPEIQQYFEDVARNFDLEQYFTTCRKVTGAQWDEITQKWQVTSRATDGRRTVQSTWGVTDGEEGEDIIDECDIFINASGFFNHWRWPKIPGRDRFKGPLVHSADYDVSIDLQDKRVAVIGNGSSGIQCVAAVQPLAKELGVFMRNPTWITGNVASKFVPDGKQMNYTPQQKQAWAEDSEKYLAYRKAVENEINDGFPFFIRGTKASADARAWTTQDMSQRLGHRDDIKELMIPDYNPGCRRPTPGTGYLEALIAENTEVVWGEIDSFTEKGIKSADGRERDFDVVICATGFDMSCVPRWPTIGTNGVDLQRAWREDPACYLSVAAENFPNYLHYLGPGAPVGHGGLLCSIERITGFMVNIIKKIQTENYSSFRLKPGKAKAWQNHQYAWNEKTVWGEPCASSFKNGDRNGRLYAFHPGSRLHYFELLRMQRWEDFDWTSLCTEPGLDFAWLANGFMEDEFAMDGDAKCWYMDQPKEVLTQGAITRCL